MKLPVSRAVDRPTMPPPPAALAVPLRSVALSALSACHRPPLALSLALLAFSACSNSSASSATGEPPSSGSSPDGGILGPPGATSTGGSSGGFPGGAGAGGTASGTGGSAAAGSGGTGAACSISLIPVSPASLDNLIAGNDARVRFHATVAGGTRAPTWTWTVLRLLPDVSVPISITPTDDPSIIEFPIATAGLYSVRVFAAAGFNCALEKNMTVKSPERNTLVFSVSPPDSLIGTFPSQRLTIAVKAANASPIALTLRSGTPIRILPQDARGQTLPSFVRVRALSGASSIDGYTDRGPVFAVLLPWPGETYEVLVVPDALVAPQLFGTSDLLATGDQLVTLAMSAGIPVAGVATDSAGSPVLDTRIVLRAGTRPSTVAASDGNGAFSLLTRPGIHSAVFSPPPGSGLPEAHIATVPGISVSPADLSMTMNLKWAHFTTAPVSLHILSGDSLADVGGASVSIDSQAELLDVGAVALSGSSGAASTVSASGAVHAHALADGNGVARFAAVPLGPYTITILAPQGSVPTRTPLVVLGGGVSRSIALAPPVVLSGRLLPAGQSAGIHVLARDSSGIDGTPIFTAIVDTAGHYQLTVTQGRTYQLEADPSGIAGFARTVLGTVNVGAQDQGAPDFAADVGIVFNGVVNGMPSSGGYSTAGGAVVQAFCPGLSTTCPAPDRPIAEAVTRSDGTFRLVLPSTLVQ
jgi:hypothetical protein